MIAKDFDRLEIYPLRLPFRNTIKLVIRNAAFIRETVEAHVPFFYQFADFYPDHFSVLRKFGGIIF